MREGSGAVGQLLARRRAITLARRMVRGCQGLMAADSDRLRHLPEARRMSAIVDIAAQADGIPALVGLNTMDDRTLQRLGPLRSDLRRLGAEAQRRRGDTDG